MTRARSARHGAGSGRGVPFLFVFFGIWLLFAVVLGGMAAQATWRDAVVATWPEVPCEVLDVRSRRSEHRRFLVVEYRYVVDGVPYTSEEWGGMQFDLRSDESPTRALARYHERQVASPDPVCFVDPENPRDAVFDRSEGAVPWPVWFGAAFVFVVGVLGLRYALRLRARVRDHGIDPSADGVGPTGDGTGDEMAERSGPVALRAESRWLPVVALAVFAALWNGMIWGAFGVDDVITGLFAVLGAGLVLVTGFLVLRALAPRARLEVSVQPVRLGEEFDVRWQWGGLGARLRDVRIVLEGEERASYQRGTDTITDTNLFHRDVLVETSSPLEMAAGEVRTRVPFDSVPSLDGPHNVIRWRLRVRADVPLSPDVDDTFTLDVDGVRAGGDRG